MQRLHLLCSSGAGLPAIATNFCTVTRKLLCADAGMIMWFTEEGDPLGFFHETAPAELKDHFVENLDALFDETDEVSARFLVAPEGPLIGKMLDPVLQARFHRGNIYHHLCVPLGHHHLLDMRAHVPGIGLAGFFAWNPPERPFTEAHVAQLEAVQPLMQQSLNALAAQARWRSVAEGTPHLITSMSGRDLLAIDPEAERVLRSTHLLQQNVSLVRETRDAPKFVSMLAAMLDGQESAELALPISNGRLVCRATRTRMLHRSGQASERLFVSLDPQIADEVAHVEFVMSLRLTALQREILYFALQGGERSDCQTRFGVSPEALKKHLRAIYSATGATNWLELQTIVSKAMA